MGGRSSHSQDERVSHEVEVEAGPEERALHLRAAVRQVLLPAGEVRHDARNGVDIDYIAGQLVSLYAGLDGSDDSLHRFVDIVLAGGRWVGLGWVGIKYGVCMRACVCGVWHVEVAQLISSCFEVLGSRNKEDNVKKTTKENYCFGIYCPGHQVLRKWCRN